MTKLKNMPVRAQNEPKGLKLTGPVGAQILRGFPGRSGAAPSHLIVAGSTQYKDPPEKESRRDFRRHVHLLTVRDCL